MRMRIESLCDAVYEGLNGQVESVELLGADGLLVRYTCDDWENPNRRRRFDLKCYDVRRHELTASPADGIEWVADHPVLWTFTSEPCYLHFTSRPTDAYSVVGILYVTHEALYQGWRNMRDALNKCYPSRLHDLLASGNGMLASGPRVALEAYAAALNGVLDSHITVGSHVHYDPEAGFHALVFDEGYVVCREVSVHDVSGSK